MAISKCMSYSLICLKINKLFRSVKRGVDSETGKPYSIEELFIRLQEGFHEIAMQTPKGLTELVPTKDGLQVEKNLREFIVEYGESLGKQHYPDLISRLPNIRDTFVENFNPRQAKDNEIVLDDSEDLTETGELIKALFFKLRFGSATDAEQHYKRTLRDDFIKVFLVNRDNGTLVTSTLQINRNIREYKLQLVDKIKAYLERPNVNGVPIYDLNEVNTSMYVNSKYKSIRDFIAIASEPLNSILSDKSTLEQNYSKAVRGDADAKLFIEAYNALITLTNFDSVLLFTMGKNIQINPSLRNSHQFSNTKYSLSTKATNMWSNQFGDEDPDTSELISTLTLMLVESSKFYTWKNSEAVPDLYLSFAMFNSCIGYIKSLSYNSTAMNLFLKDYLKDNISKSTRDFITTKSNFTVADLVSYIDDNPQLVLNTIIDLLANTKITDKLGTTLYYKNLIWTIYKEIAGKGTSCPRSLYRLQALMNKGNAYSIVAQEVCSIYPMEYIQYGKNNAGYMSTRKLTGYGLYTESMQLLSEIRARTTIHDPEKFDALLAKYSIANIELGANLLNDYKSGDIELINTIRYTIPLGNNPETSITLNTSILSNIQNKWDIFDNPYFRQFVKECTSIDLDSDTALTTTYVELFKGNGTIEDAKSRAFDDIINICNKILIALYFNNKVLPRATAIINTPARCKEAVDAQGLLKGTQINKDDGTIPILSDSTTLSKLTEARAIVKGTLAAALVRTGEGTNVSNFSLSNLSAQHYHQLLKNRYQEDSAIKGLTYVSGHETEEGFTVNPYNGILVRREVKQDLGAKPCTRFSAGESIQFSFINDWVSAFARLDTDSYDVTGRYASTFITGVNSDKSRIDELLINLAVESRQGKPYKDLNDIEIEQEIKAELGPVYAKVLSNISEDYRNAIAYLTSQTTVLVNGVETSMSVAEFLFGAAFKTVAPTGSALDILTTRMNSLNSYFASVNINPIDGLFLLSNVYNNGQHIVRKVINNVEYEGIKMDSHQTNPMMFGEEIHYNPKSKTLTPNTTLISLWARLSANDAERAALIRSGFYKGMDAYADINGFFKLKDYNTAMDLFNSNFKVYLLNKKATNSPEVNYLIDNYGTWIDEEGAMIIAKMKDATGQLVNITDTSLVNPNNIVLHPMLSKMNRMDYLFTQPYNLSTVGSHYVHSNKGNGDNVIEQEGARLNAANKRNNAQTGTLHKFTRNVINGAPKDYKIAIIQDIKSDVYNAMGISDTHKPLDGGMFCNAWLSYLENNSLEGEKAGIDKKPFGTFFFGRFAAGGTIKTASFAPINELMLKYPTYRALQLNMSDRRWLKRETLNGVDLYYDDLNILENNLGIYDSIFNKQSNGLYAPTETIYYQRLVKGVMNLYTLYQVEYLGNNQYRIYDLQVDEYGDPLIDADGNTVIIKREVTIDTNWKIFTELFGGYRSLEKNDDGNLVRSDHSNELMVRIINDVGEYLQSKDSLAEDETIVTQDAFYQPLKYSDILYLANIGAIKSAYVNVNPSSCLTNLCNLNFFTIPLAQLGIQLDKEHHADESDVSMPTLIMSACIDRGFTQDEAISLYKALATLTGLATLDYIDDVHKIQTGLDSSSLITKVATMLVKDLLNSSGDNEAITNALNDIIDVYKQNGEIPSTSVIGKIAWSNSRYSNQVYSKIASNLSKEAIRMKFSGVLSVICPTHGVVLLHGNRTLSSYNRIGNDIKPEEVLLREEQDSIITSANFGNFIIGFVNDTIQVTDREGNLLQVRPNNNDTYTLTDLDGSTYTINKTNEVFNNQGKKILESNGRKVRDNRLIFHVSDVYGFINQPNDNEEFEVTDVQALSNTVSRKLDLASHIDFQHNYLIQFNNGDIEEITVNTPGDYQYIKQLLLDGREDGTIVSYIAEDIIKPRELAAMNVRCKGRGVQTPVTQTEFSLYDIQSSIDLFNINAYKKAIVAARLKWNEISKNESDEDKAEEIFNETKEFKEYSNLGTKILNSYHFKNTIPAELQIFDMLDGDIKLKDLILKLIEILLRKQLHKDLRALSPNFKGLRQVVFNNQLIEVDPTTVEHIPYELIMPKIFKSKFGLNNTDDLQDILEDLDFFAKRSIKKLNKRLVSPDYYTYELKCNNGKHYYILDSNDPRASEIVKNRSIFAKNPEFYPIVDKDKLVHRVTIEGETIYDMASRKDMVYSVQGQDVIVTDNPAFYLENLEYNHLLVSPKSNEATVLELLKSKPTNYLFKQFVKRIKDTTTGKNKDLAWHQRLCNEANDFNTLTPDIINKYYNGEVKGEILPNIILQILRESKEIYVSFNQSLNVIAGRTPGQSMQSFMTQRVVAFDDRDSNTARVSTFLLFLLGSKYKNK